MVESINNFMTSDLEGCLNQKTKQKLTLKGFSILKKKKKKSEHHLGMESCVKKNLECW
jgi:hypothetical protein